MIRWPLPVPVGQGRLRADLDGGGALVLHPVPAGWAVCAEGPAPAAPFGALATLAATGAPHTPDVLLAPATRRTPEGAHAALERRAGPAALRRLGRLLLALPEDASPVRLLTSGRAGAPCHVLAHGRRLQPIRTIAADDPKTPSAFLDGLRIPMVLPDADGAPRLRLLPLHAVAFHLPRTAHARLALREALGLRP